MNPIIVTMMSIMLIVFRLGRAGPSDHGKPLVKSHSQPILRTQNSMSSHNGGMLKKSHSASDLLRGRTFTGYSFDGSSFGETLIVHVRERALTFATHVVEKEVKEYAPKFEIGDMFFDRGGFNLSIKNVNVTKFDVPGVSARLVPPKTLELTLKGGYLEAHADVYAVNRQRTYLNAGGFVKAWTKKPDGVHVVVAVKIGVGEKKVLDARITGCNATIPFEFKSTGKVFSALSQVSGALNWLFGGMINSTLCAFLEEHIDTVFNRIPTNFVVGAHYGLDYKIQSITVTKDEAKVEIKTVVTDSEKAKHLHTALKGHHR